MSFCTVTDTYEDGSGAFYTGTVQFAPTVELQDTVNHITIGVAPIIATLTSGAISVNLHFTDDANIIPNNPASNSWVYRVTELVIPPGQTAVEARQPYYLQIPAATGNAVSLSNLPHYGAQPGYGWFPW